MTKRLAIGMIALSFPALLAIGCAHNNASTPTADSSGTMSGEIRTQNASTAAVPGPAVADSSGNVYMSSAQGSSGNAANVGTNTNIQQTPQASSATVTQTEMTPAPVTTTTQVTEVAPPPPPPPPAVTTTTTTTEVTQPTHVRRTKD